MSPKDHKQKILAASGPVCWEQVKWKSKFGSMDVSDAKRLKALEDENARLKRLVADMSLDNAMLNDVNCRKW